jgi:hypothetical protein
MYLLEEFTPTILKVTIVPSLNFVDKSFKIYWINFRMMNFVVVLVQFSSVTLHYIYAKIAYLNARRNALHPSEFDAITFSEYLGYLSRPNLFFPSVYIHPRQICEKTLHHFNEKHKYSQLFQIESGYLIVNQHLDNK